MSERVIVWGVTIIMMIALIIMSEGIVKIKDKAEENCEEDVQYGYDNTSDDAS